MATIDKVVLPYYKTGRGRPLFMVIGFHSTVKRFIPLIKYLSDYFTIYVPELPGNSTPYPLPMKHTAINYAKIFNKLLKHLKLKNCLLAGFSLGAIIVIRMLQQIQKSKVKMQKYNSKFKSTLDIETGGARSGSPKSGVPAVGDFGAVERQDPYINIKHIMLVAGIYDADLFRIPLRFRFAIEIIKRVNPNNPIIYNMAYYCLHSRRFLNWFLTMVYRQEPDFEKVVEHQIELTLNMDTRAWLELAHDIFNLHFSGENLRFNIPATLVNNLSDDILDGKKTTEGFLKMFPKGKNFNLTLPRHSPKGPINLDFVDKLLKPLLPQIKRLSN